MVLPDPLRAGQEWVKVLDFGIAKVGTPASAPVDEAVLSDTASGTVMGTPLYMAPEQHSGADVVDGLADVFTFGVMLYEMLAGKRPYKDSALNLLSVPVPPLANVRKEVPKELAVLVHRMLALVPAERPAMAEVEARLTALAGHDLRGRRKRLLLLAGGLVAVLAVVSGVVVHRLQRPLSLAESRERALLQIKKSLASPELPEELQAAVALGRSRDIEYRPLLEPLLAEKQTALAAAAARGLGEMSAIESQPVLLALLDRSPDVAVRLEAATALAQLSHPRGVETLRALLQSGDDLTKVEAALRLLAQGDRSGAPLLRRATERDDGTSERAVPVLVALARVGDAQAKEQLTRLFLRATSSGKDAPLIAYGLARLGDAAAYKELVRLAASSGPEVVVAARFLSALGQPEGYPVLVRVGADDGSTERLREIAFDGLGDSARPEAASVIAKTFSEAAATKRLRLAAAGSILQLAAGAVGVYASRSLSWARAAVGSDSGSTRELAVMLLGDLENDETIPALRLALKDKEVEVRHGAARALGRKSVRTALAALVDALDDSERDVRTAGMQSIGQVVAALRKRGEQNFEIDVTARISQMLEKGSAIDRIVAAGTLLRMGDSGQRGLLQEGLRSVDPLARRLALELLDADSSVLVAALSDGERLVRFAAARRLALIGSRDGIAILLAALREGGPEGLIAYGLLKKLGQSVEPPADLLTLLTGRLLREKEAVLDALPDLPAPAAPAALDLLLLASRDTSNMVRRRAAEIAHGFYVRTLQIAFRNLILELRNDPDIVVRSRVAELLTTLPPGAADHAASAAPTPATPAPQPTPPAAPTPTPPPVAPVPPEKPAPVPIKSPIKAPVTIKAPIKNKAPIRLEDDPRAKTMGLIQIYVMKNGRCQLANQYFLPPGDHIINVGKQSQTVSVYAGVPVPIRQCP